MCGLGHILETAGITTVVVALVPQHVKIIRPPRALLVPFELGRPFGAPDDDDLQRTVLSAALDLLDQQGPGPILETLVADVPTASVAEAWVCPVTFATPSSGSATADRLLEEARLLMPWFDRSSRLRGHTAADVSGLAVESICSWLCEFLTPSPPVESPVAGRALGETFKLAVEDLKAFYLEAVSAQPNCGTAQELNNWFWDTTVAGEVLRALREGAPDQADEVVRIHASFTLVPEVQIKRRAALTG